MKKLMFMLVLATLAGCGNGNSEINVDSSNVITDSSALMDSDTTSVIGANRIGEGEAKIDTTVSRSNLGK